MLGCLRTKLAVVAEDERDAGRRQVLNLGHTVGHAIEAATGYRRYRHGEAVGIGLLAALRLSGKDALRGEVAELLAARGLPLAFEGAAVDDVLDAAARDKKREGGRVPFVLVEAPGDVSHGHDVAPGDLRAAVEELHVGMKNRVDVMHGVNLDQLGRRDPDHYGGMTLPELEVKVKRFATRAGLRGHVLADQPRGRVLREPAHRRRAQPTALILNPGAWTHYSWAIRDALEVAGVPAVEVHLSAIDEREEWRRTSVIRDLCVGSVQGKGVDGYREALELLKAAMARDPRIHRRPRGPAGRAPGRARARLAAGHRPGERALPDRLHRHQRRLRGHARSERLFLTDFRYVEQAEAQVRDFERLPAGTRPGGRPGPRTCAAAPASTTPT